MGIAENKKVVLGFVEASNSRLSQNARKMAVESPEFLRFGRLCACDLSRA